MSVCIYNATNKSLTRTDSNSKGYYGEWVNGTTYKSGSEVKHDGIYWIALRTTKVEPTKDNTEDWKEYIDISIVDKLSVDESNDLFYNNTRISNIIWSGTKAEYETAMANGEIKEGMFVNIEDDFVEDGSDLSGYLTKDDASNLYVTKINGKGLSTNDLTNELKTKYDENIENLNNSIRSVYSITKNLCNVQEGYILVNSSKQLITGMYLDSGDYVLSFNSDSSDGTYTIETVNDDMSSTGDMTIDDGTANIKSGKNTKTFHIIGSAKIAISSTVETELYNMQIEAGTSATSYDDYIDSLWSLTSGVAGIRKTMVDKTDLDTVNNSLLSLITNNTNYVENFSGDETADNAPMGIRKGMTVEGYPEIFGEWVLYKTYYYDTEHQYGWQTAYDMNASRIAYRYRRNGSWFEWNYLNDVKTVDFNGTKYLFTFKAGDNIGKDITDDVRVKNNPYFALDVTNVNNIGLNIEFLTGETSQKEITVYKSLEKDGEVCDTFVYNFKPSSTHKSEYLNINVSGDSGYIYFKLSNTGGTGWAPKITSIALNNSAGGQSSINSYSNKVDYTISADYESIISKRENFSYKTNNIVTLNFSINVAGDIAANKEIVRVSPIPKSTIYCFIHDAYDGTVIPAYIDANGILKIRKAVSLDGSYNVSATYGV